MAMSVWGSHKSIRRLPGRKIMTRRNDHFNLLVITAFDNLHVICQSPATSGI